MSHRRTDTPRQFDTPIAQRHLKAEVANCVGGVVSPVLANLFMHYAFDAWMAREYPGIRFERYADDAVVHCVTERQARTLVAAIGDRMEQVGLRLHPDKTKSCTARTGSARLDYGHTAFTFLGFTFRPVQRARSTERCSSRSSRRSARTPRTRSVVRSADGGCTAGSGCTLAELARWINPVVRGWMQYYGAFYRSALYPLLSRINAYLMRWIRNEIQTAAHHKKAMACWQRITGTASPALRALGMGPSVARSWWPG